MATHFTKKNDNKYCCKICDFNTCKLTDYNRHLTTQKHIRNTNATLSNKKNDKNIFTCEKCEKEYNDRTGLWRHKKFCSFEENKQENAICYDDKHDKLIEYLMKENKEIKEMILEIVKNGTHQSITNNTTNTNSHNKAFNLNFFLNETCKDAMNIMDFVDSIKLQLTDLEKIGEVGYTQGISNIITTNLKALDITQRPVHCTDKKRGIMYIKDENKWEKEDDEKTRLKNLIIRVSNKNIKLLPQFREKYPDYKVSTSRTSDKYDKIVLEAMGGSGDNDKEKTEKIIQNISKCVVIDKYE
jgi:hypothetical protein